MKILNRQKTHFMQQDENGAYKVKFGTVSKVYAVINNILDRHQTDGGVDEFVQASPSLKMCHFHSDGF